MNKPEFELERNTNGSVVVVFAGAWKLSESPPPTAALTQKLFDSTDKISKVSFQARDLGEWDSALLGAVYGIAQRCVAEEIAIDYSGFPQGLQGLMKLALAVPPQKQAAAAPKALFFSRVGCATLRARDSSIQVLSFLGEASVALWRFVTGRARVRKSDFLEIILQAGPYGLPIVTLISTLVGLILAYIGALQLQQFGAQIYVANLVGLAMAREMGGIMAGIILAGRTGAAFAAQLGTMQVNEEIDALETLGISPMEFLVLPRMVALIAMIPLLCLYAIVAGIAGGFIVSVGVLGISFPIYYQQTIQALHLTDIWVGVGKSFVFGALVALCGCYYGMKCGRSASAVGEATTSAVVSSIVCVVVADAIFAVLFGIIGI